MPDNITWLRFEETFFAPHPKVYSLAAALGISVDTATIQVARLWFFVARYDRSDYHGRVTEHVDQLDNQVLRGVTVADLVAAELVDSTDVGLYVHDWYDTNGRYLEKYQKERDRKRKSRAQSADGSADSPRTGEGTGRARSADSPPPTGQGRDGTGPDTTLPVDGGGQGGAAQHAPHPPDFPQADVLLTLPALPSAKADHLVDFHLRRGTVATIQDQYPGTDVLAVAQDMNRKLRSGARDPYTVRGMPKALAGWTASAAAAGEFLLEDTE